MTLVDERPAVAPDVAAEPAPSPRTTPAAPAPGEAAPSDSGGGVDRAADKLRMLQRARKSAVAVTVFIACGSFGLSF